MTQRFSFSPSLYCPFSPLANTGVYFCLCACACARAHVIFKKVEGAARSERNAARQSGALYQS